MNEKLLTVRVDENLKKAFELVAKETDMTASQMVRALMRETVLKWQQENRQQSLLEPKKQARKGK